MESKKDTNFELLKVFAMLMIVCHHLITKNAYNIDVELTGLDESRLFLQLIGNHAFIGNNLFFMVSAWFLCTKTESSVINNTINRVWKLEKVMLFYSIGIPLIWGAVYGFGGTIFNLGSLFPLAFGKWWYPTAYAIFIVFYPFYQKGLQFLKREEVQKLIISMVLLWTVPTIIPVKLQLGANNITCFFMLYALIFYIRKFQPNWASNKSLLRWVTFGGYAITFVSIIVLDFWGEKSALINENACYYIRGDWRIMPVLISVAMFLWIAQIKMKKNNVINWMGSLTFAIYLIHMHPLMINFLFKKIFILEPYIGSLKLIPYTITVTLLIFIGCAFVDQVRKWIYWIVGRTLKKIWNIRKLKNEK